MSTATATAKQNKKENNTFSILQRIGRSLFLPVSLLPAAGILLGLGASFTNATTISSYGLAWLLGKGTILHYILSLMSAVGSAVFGNLPLLFALGVALGMATNEKAVAVISAGLSFIIMHTTINIMMIFNGQILSDGSLASNIVSSSITNVLGIKTLEMGVFGGIITGLIVGWLHNRFYKTELPAALSFFSGVRFVPIICTVFFVFVGVAAFFIWPFIQTGINGLGDLISSTGNVGLFVYGALDRLGIPFGLHHMVYMPFFQTGLGGTAIVDGVQVTGAQNIFFAELGSASTTVFSDTARWMDKYPFMLGGLPGATLAMYVCAKSSKKKMVGGMMLSAALTAILTGITEPIEFTFLFIAPVLFAVHAIFAGLTFVITHLLHITIGTTFSCGLIDFVLFGVMQGNVKTHWLYMIPVVIADFALYFLVFRFAILRWNIKTPGREDDDVESKLYTRSDSNILNSASKSNKQDKSPAIVKALGGLDNISNIDCCATRLRVTVINSAKVNDMALKATGSSGVIKKGNGIQVVYGPHVSVINSNLQEYISDKTPVS